MATSLGKRIMYYRKKIGISQKDLAAAVGMSPNAISYYEKDKRKPNIVVLTKIADVLDITSDALLGFEIPDLKAKNKKEYALLCTFRNLNGVGQEHIMEYMSFVSNSPKYTEPA